MYGLIVGTWIYGWLAIHRWLMSKLVRACGACVAGCVRVSGTIRFGFDRA